MKEIYLKDYKPTNYQASNIELDFNLNPTATKVVAKTKYKINSSENDLVLNGEDLKLESILIDNKKLDKSQYKLTNKTLIIPNAPDEFELTITTVVNPQENTKLEGLYISSDIFCTQCEAEGFRRITYFQDRPDVMCLWQVSITADKQKYPIMLSNGNEGIDDNYTDNGDGTHTAFWSDPFKKPCYLFALVAGDLVGIEKKFVTQKKKKVKLKIYTNHGNENRLDYAMDSLVRSMKWDEKVWGRTYEHDIFNIVAVDDFNMGAMENTTLNIFNSKLILADNEIATDLDYSRIESVVGHEYFHNWTGNRITCRDWFQLSLKEGLTVFRDQEFSSNERSKPVKRIEDVIELKSRQFKEDASPLAHPVRPEKYVEINNFYTATVYEKGAEVIRMLKTLLGNKNFYKGADIYFEKYDGTATTCDNWIKCMEQASKKDLTQFKLWYCQASTPHINITENYANNKYSITVKQKLANSKYKPMHIPIALGLLDKNGNEIQETNVYELNQWEQTFDLGDYAQKPILSFNRSFSAPINISGLNNIDEKIILFKYDNDTFNRWQSGQELFYECIKNKNNEVALMGLTDGIKNILSSEEEHAYIAQCITIPSLDNIYQNIDKNINPHDIYNDYVKLNKLIYKLCKLEIDNTIEKIQKKIQQPFSPDAKSAGLRLLDNICQVHKSTIDFNEKEMQQRFNKANNMTTKLNALKIMTDNNLDNTSLNNFYIQYKDNTTVMDKYFSVQALSLNIDVSHIKALITKEQFNIKNPNKVRSLIGAFSMNPISFHQINGEGYKLLADVVIKLNTINPQIGSRLVQAFSSYKKFEKQYSDLMEKELNRILSTDNLSDDICEVVSKMLN